MGHLKWLAAITLLGLAAGCDEEPINPFDALPSPDRGAMEMSVIDVGMMDMTVDAVVDMSTCPPPTFAPDVDDFDTNVAGPMFTACSLCHQNPDAPDNAFYLADDPATDAVESATFVAPSCLESPETCDIIAWHPEGHPGYVEDPLLTALVNWITLGAMIPPCPDGPDPGEPDVGVDMGPPPVPCEALPQVGDDLAFTDQFRDEFEASDAEGVSHNDILVGSCARNGACHALAGEGDGYYLLEGDEQCYADWNFFATQIYIDMINPPRSPLLTQPRTDLHGGRDVFRGADDPRHVRLLRWIEDEKTRRQR